MMMMYAASASHKAMLSFLVATAISFGTADSFVPTTTTKPAHHHHYQQQQHQQRGNSVQLHAEEWSASSSSSSAAVGSGVIGDVEGVVLHESVALRDPGPDERGKGGVEVVGGGSIRALEVLARIPRDLIVSSVDAPTRALEAAADARNLTWATDLTAAALVAMHPTDEELRVSAAAIDENGAALVDAVSARKKWIRSWEAGGWATDGADLGPPDVNFGSKDVTGSLLSTGTDNDHNIYAKFRMRCHPVLLRASLGLEVLTGCTEEEAREALTARGFAYRSMRDALEPLVLESSERQKGSLREKRCWDVADALSRVLSRATTLEVEVEDAGDDAPAAALVTHAIVPVHERLEHSARENSKLVSSGNEVLLVATRDIAGGEAITRDYASSPRLPNDKSEGALHLLLQFGLPPKSWPAAN